MQHVSPDVGAVVVNAIMFFITGKHAPSTEVLHKV
jgi:hypothetical protein